MYNATIQFIYQTKKNMSGNNYTSFFGFSPATWSERLHKLSEANKRMKSDWRKTEKVDLVMTNLKQEWRYEGAVEGPFIVIQVCPFGMKEHMTKKLANPKCRIENVVPSRVKQHFGSIFWDVDQRAAINIATSI